MSGDPVHTPPPLPPPAKGASLKQILAMLGFGSMGSLYVVKAVQSQPGHSLGIGTILILFAFVFFLGLITRNHVVELITSGILVLGAGVQIALAFNGHHLLWSVGALFFSLCVVLIQLKHHFVDQSSTESGELRNPYS